MSATRTLDLRSGVPVWLAYDRRLPKPTRATHKDFSIDVLIVGAGISGALCAYRLAQSGRRVAVIDRRAPVAGSTSASTALLQFEIDRPLVCLARRVGMRDAGRVWRRSREALQELGALVRRERLTDTLRVRPSVYLSGSELRGAAMRGEFNARVRCGLPCEYLMRRELWDRFGLRREAALVSPNNLTVDPRALTSSLLRRARARGAMLLAPLELDELEIHRHTVTALMKDGQQIEARHVVLCTGYELPKIVPRSGHSIAST